MQYSQILWAVLYGYAFFGETPDCGTAIGAAIIILSGIYVVFREETPHVSRSRPVLAQPVALRQRHLSADQQPPPAVAAVAAATPAPRPAARSSPATPSGARSATKASRPGQSRIASSIAGSLPGA